MEAQFWDGLCGTSRSKQIIASCITLNAKDLVESKLWQKQISVSIFPKGVETEAVLSHKENSYITDF